MKARKDWNLVPEIKLKLIKSCLFKFNYHFEHLKRNVNTLNLNFIQMESIKTTENRWFIKSLYYFFLIFSI